VLGQLKPPARLLLQGIKQLGFLPFVSHVLPLRREERGEKRRGGRRRKMGVLRRRATLPELKTLKLELDE
jgi:hypothetical protein